MLDEMYLGVFMDFQVINQPVSVTEVVGEVIAVDSKRNARLLKDGEYLNKGEILITINHSSVAVKVFG